MSYTIELKPSAARALRQLPKSAQRRVGSAIEGLSATPRPSGSKKLKGGEDLLRIRTGDYRIIYKADDEKVTVLVIALGHRKSIYRSLKR